MSGAALTLEHLRVAFGDHVVIDERFYRPAEVDLLVGDPSKAKQQLGWSRDVSFEQLVTMMVDADVALIKRERGL